MRLHQNVLLLLPQRRLFSSSPHCLRSNQAKGKYNWGKRSSIDLENAGGSVNTSKFSRLTADQLATYKTPPKGVKVLTRDFIHDALYNPQYGYFTKRAMIFSPPSPLDFRSMKNAVDFDEAVAQIYADLGRAGVPSSSTSSTMLPSAIGPQLWHTPVEVFQVRTVIFGVHSFCSTK